MKITMQNGVTLDCSMQEAINIINATNASAATSAAAGVVTAVSAGPRTLAQAREEGAVRWIRNNVAKPVAKAMAKASVYSANKAFDGAEITVAYAEPVALEVTAFSLETTTKVADYIGTKTQSWGEAVRARRNARRFVQTEEQFQAQHDAMVASFVAK